MNLLNFWIENGHITFIDKRNERIEISITTKVYC